MFCSMYMDFGSGPASLKFGPAAIGQTAYDFWNSYGPNLTGKTNLSLADRTPSVVTVNVYGAGPVVPGNANPDPMYEFYLYQYGLPGNLTVDTTNLPPGAFDFYYYAGCGDYNYQLYVNGVSQGQGQSLGKRRFFNQLAGRCSLCPFSARVTLDKFYLVSACGNYISRLRFVPMP